MRKFVGVVGLVVATLSVVGCSTSKSAAVTSADLTGLWQLTMPDNSQQMFRITGEGEQRFRISKRNSAFNGTYERQGNRLVMVAPDDPLMTEFVWKIDAANHLTLIKEPPASKTGHRYRTATLLKTG